MKYLIRAALPLILSIVAFGQCGKIGRNPETGLSDCFGGLSLALSGTVATIPATCAVGQLYFATDATAGQQIFMCSATNTWTQQLNSGSGGASTALDNLASVSINTSLLAQTGVDAGSTTKPFRDLFLWGSGTFGSTYLRLTGTPTGNRVVTIPDATDTLVNLGSTQTLAAKTLTTPTISATGFTNANHAHAAANSGGTLDAAAIASGALAAARLTNAGVMTGDVTTTFPAVTVSKVNGIAYSATAAAHSVEVITTANTTATAKVIPDCTDTGGNHLNFTQSTDAFSCGTSGGAGGGVSSIDTATGAILLGAGLTRSSQTLSFDSSVLAGAFFDLAASNAVAGANNTFSSSATEASVIIVPANIPSSIDSGGLYVTLTGRHGWFDGTNAQHSVSVAGSGVTAPSAPAAGLATFAGSSFAVTSTALGTGVLTWLGTPSSANLAAAVTGETGSGNLVFATSPTLTTPDIGTPSAAVLTNATGYLWNSLASRPFVKNAQTTTYQLLTSDFDQNKVITVASGTFTATLVASGSQPADGKCVRVLNYGTGVVTVARSGQNINGAAANLTLSAGSASAPTGMDVCSDGTNYFAQPFGAGGGATIGGAVSGGTSGRILYVDASGNLAQHANLTFTTSDTLTTLYFTGTNRLETGSSGLIKMASNYNLVGAGFGKLDVKDSDSTNFADVGYRTYIHKGAAPSTPSGCGTAIAGANTAGTITSGTTGTCTPVVTFAATAPNGYACSMSNQTTANLMRQTASTTTTATFSGTTVSGDVLVYKCDAY